MKLISINIEGDKHLNRVLPFVSHELPDILCLQEVTRPTFSQLETMGYSCIFLPLTRRLYRDELLEEGIALCTHTPVQNIQLYYYRGAETGLEIFRDDRINETYKNGVLSASVTLGEKSFTVATTHFTWTPDGELPSAEQINDMDVLLSHIETLEPHIICGDFNIPRNHNVLYKRLTERYTDSVPMTYASSLDASLHRLGSVPEKQHLFTSFMVDYIFTQPPYTACDVRLEFGLSDHAAVVATIQ